ncbi:acyl-CoA/acyl-ACP dehydrogenase [Planotetraspora sp. A-T 1434]|uniref:acyl-CoA dehydrogenase family protein n=1 Tax=Planotetraspora sp. A-T 1434 TaxID=2979219 RepID=UPI0021BF2EFF|nr:acyl-CoA dehydrogenase family protein [Planotetraspora sp. A-T 1434]MCT9930965.1 acyl-CoA/acyl-ACP dehydrogenase [Planotetraspora sp. A-T 1434]
MTLLYTEVEEELRAAVRDLLADKSSSSAVLTRVDGAASPGGMPYDMDLWKALARDIGVAGLLVPEELGGAGASAREVAVVLEELGRAVAPVPFLSSAVLATTALLGAGDGVAVRGLLERLASGETTAALAVSFAASPYQPLSPAVTLDPSPEAAPMPDGAGAASTVAPVSPMTPGVDGTATGRVTGVVGAEAADVLLVPVRLSPGDGVALCAVDVSAAQVTTLPSLDLTRPVATVSFSGARAEVLGTVAGVRDALLLGAGLLASEQLGVAEWCLNTTVAYVNERKQFARPVGSFQAIKHRLADLWLEVVGARAAARNAADLLGTDAEVDSSKVAVAVAVAQAYCGAVAVHAAEECVQLHGGIGMTWEHPAHLYLKRAKADEIALGTPGDHRQALTEPADLPGPVS